MIKVYVENKLWDALVNIFIIREGQGDDRYKYDVSKREWVKQKRFVDQEPSIVLHADMLQPLLQALSDQNIKVESEHKLEGLIEAQSKHLEDMRRLVFEDGGKDQG